MSLFVVREVTGWLGKSRTRKETFRLCVLLGMVVGLLAHAFMFTNKIYNHDELEYYYDLGNAGMAAGRYFLYLFWKIFSDLSTPWLNGILGVFFTSMATFFFCDAMELRQNWQVYGATFIMQLYPANLDSYCYMYQAHVFMLGIMLAFMTPWMMRYGGKWRWFLASMAVWLATGIYQVYVMLAIGALIVFVIHKTLRAEEEQLQGSKVWSIAVQCAAVALAGLVLYLLGLKLETEVLHVTLNEYQGVNQTGSLTLSTIPQKIVQAYQMLWDEYVADVPAYVNGRTMLFRLPLALSGMAGLLVAVVRRFIKKQFAHGMLLSACGLLLPLACCGILFMGDEIGVHIITLYPAILILLLPIAVMNFDVLSVNGIRRILIILLAMLYFGWSFNGIIYANQFYTRHYQVFNRAENFAGRLAARIEMLEEYYPGIPLKTWGWLKHEEPLLYYELDIIGRFLSCVGLRNELDYFWPYCVTNLLNAVEGLPVADGQEWEPETPEQLLQLEAMPAYPAEGSIAVIDGVCVVKFPD